MYKAAVIGLGKIGLTFDIPYRGSPASHSTAYHLQPEVDLVAAVGRRNEQEDNLAVIAPEAKFYLDTELSSMLQEQPLDLISICTPSTVRYELLKTVLEQSRAKVIFLEKPIANSIGEAQKIIFLSREHSDRTIVVNLSRRWSEGAMRIREAVINGTYGKLKKAHLRYSRGIFNTGSHLFDMVGFFAGSIDQVKVVERVPTNLDSVGDWTYSFLFTAGNGEVTGYAEAFDDRNYVLFEIVLYFENGMIEMLKSGDEIRYYGTEMHPMQPGIKSLMLERTEEGVLGKSSNMQNAVDHLVQILKNGVEPMCTLEDGIYPLYVAEALNQSYVNDCSVRKVLV